MKQLGALSVIITISVAVAACSSETTVTQHKVQKDIWGDDEAFAVGKDADGNPTMKSDKRSSFENKSSNVAMNRDFSGKDYTKNSYRKERWTGKSRFSKKSYQGGEDASQYKKEPWFVQKQTSTASMQSGASKKKFSINPFRSKRATEQGGARLSTSTDARVSNRRSSYKQPEIRSWKDQKGLSVGDTNSMLGR